MAEVILNTAKSILREIIDDDMNDFEKIKAIHDWLVLNVTYDDELLNLSDEVGSEVNSVFKEIDKTCEYNSLKVLNAFRENNISEIPPINKIFSNTNSIIMPNVILFLYIIKF